MRYEGDAMTQTFSTPARTSAPSSGRAHAALQRAVPGVLLLTLAALLTGCELDASAGWDKTHGTNRAESVGMDFKVEGGL